MQQKTINKRVQGVGIGLHKGVPIKLILEPLEANEGIIFYRSDLGLSIKSNPQNVVNTKMATVIGAKEGEISTIEHLLSAVYAYGIDNLRIIIDNEEVPVMDGSSTSFCMLLDEAGIKSLNAPKQVMVIKKYVKVSHEDKFVSIEPSNKPVFNFSIKFNHVAIGEQNYTFVFNKQDYIKEISRARTFGFLQDVQYLRSIGLALGGSLDNAIVLDEKKILNPEGLRYENEFVRHKILDALGDLSLLGMPVIGNYKSFAGSHHLNHLLTKEILKSRENYEIKEVDKNFTTLYDKALA